MEAIQQPLAAIYEYDQANDALVYGFLANWAFLIVGAIAAVAIPILAYRTWGRTAHYVQGERQHFALVFGTVACTFLAVLAAADAIKGLPMSLEDRRRPLQPALADACTKVRGGIAAGTIRLLPRDLEDDILFYCGRTSVIAAINAPTADFRFAPRGKH